MSRRQPRFEIVRTAAGWHARFRAANGQVVWTTESYTRRRAAIGAIKALPTVYDRGTTTLLAGGVWFGSHRVEVREVDER